MPTPIIAIFLQQRAGAAATWTMVNPRTFFTLQMGLATGVQTVQLPTANNQRGNLCAVRVTGAVPVQTVSVQSPPGTTIDTFAASVNGTRSYLFNGSVYVPFGASVS